MVSIGFCVGWRDLGCFETWMFLLQPASKAASVLRIERDGFGREIWALFQYLLPGGNLMPHDFSLLSAQFYYRRSFWGDSARNSADTIPPVGGNCADKPPLRRSSIHRTLKLVLHVQVLRYAGC